MDRKDMTRASVKTSLWPFSINELRWSGGGFYINPLIGVVRGDRVSVSPADTTTYVLTATGPYGRSTAKVTVKAQ
jgi:hypothetical protein